MTERLSISLQVTLVKNSSANAGDLRDTVSIPAVRRLPGEGHGNPLQYLCLENPLDKGACGAIDHAFTGSDMTEVIYHTATHLICNTSVLICIFLVLNTL